MVHEINQNKALTEDELEIFKKLAGEAKLEAVLLDVLRTREFTVREYQILQLGKSNAAYHYLGCAKIMAQIGKGFAEALPTKPEK